MRKEKDVKFYIVDCDGYKIIAKFDSFDEALKFEPSEEDFKRQKRYHMMSSKTSESFIRTYDCYDKRGWIEPDEY